MPSVTEMRIAVIGARGQLGSELMHRLGDDALGLTHEDIEITDRNSVDRSLTEARPDLVINTAAYNLVDHAEDEREQAFRVNTSGPRHLAEWCNTNDAVLVHISTDYVFGGEPDRIHPWTESDQPSPDSAYGLSKIGGENFVTSICPRNFIVRTCGLYGGRPGRGSGNFVETMLRLGRERGSVSVVDDQRCCPTSAGDLAEALIELSRTDAWGLYHVTNSGEATWYEFAREIFQASGLNIDVTPITTAEFGAAARRPPYSVLDCGKLESVIGRGLPEWREALKSYVAEL